jgi:predicted DCC family thiol-disulfide oxidoreductase YuxK
MTGQRRRIAITGATGFVGGRVKTRLEADGYEVLGLSRGTGIDLARPDLPALETALQGCGAVVHCAGINREIGNQTYDAVHIRGTQALVAAARAAGVIRNSVLKNVAEGGGAMPDDDRLLVLYDGDCGICTRTARVLRRLDRRQSLRLVGAQAADDIAGVPRLEERLTYLYVRDRRGRWTRAGAAAVQIAEAVPALRPLAVAARIPGAPAVIERIYSIVASNRHRISRALGWTACPVDPPQ